MRIPVSNRLQERHRQLLTAGAALLLLLLCLAPATSLGQSSWVVHSFAGTDGSYPHGRLVLSGTSLYGTTYGTYFGGTSNLGTVFTVNTDGSGFKVLKYFAGYPSDGANPEAGLVLRGTTLFGTTCYGGSGNAGTVFKINTDGSGDVLLKSLTGSDGRLPLAGLAVSGTTLYGAASAGGSAYGQGGTIFKLAIDGSDFAVLRPFSSASSGAVYPYGTLAVSGTKLFGTTRQGGSSNHGTVFQFNTDGNEFSVLRNFSGSDGELPSAGLVLSDTTLYGTTESTVFKINADGSGFTTLTNRGGSLDTLQLSGTALYGTTYEGGGSMLGTVFKVNTDGTDFRILKSFAGSDGANPRAGVVLSGMVLYGSTSKGGGSDFGTVFGLEVAPGAPRIVIQPASQTVKTWSTAYFGVSVSGAEPLAYQWLFNITNAIAGATDSTFQLPHVAPSQAGSYSVVITNVFGAVTSAPATLSVIPPNTAWVTTCTEAALRAALDSATTVDFACDGTITLARSIAILGDTVLDGGGHHVTISGADTVRVFSVSTNVTLTAINLTIDNGRSTNGAGIFNAGGTLILQGVTFQTNVATGDPGGGAIFNQGGTVHAANCVFSGNVASNVVFASGPPTSSGGALYNAGTFVASACAFLQNQATGRAFPAPAPEAADGRGGAICNVGVLSIDSSVFVSNAAIGLWGNNGQDTSGTSGSPGGSAHGGALFNAGVATLVNSTIVSNTCTGGGGGWGGCGPYTMSGRDRYYYGPGGNGGYGGSGIGGGICSDGYPVRMTNCTVAFNSASAGVGGVRGDGAPPGSTGANGTAGGAVQADGNSPLIDNILASNSPTNCSGTVTDLGHNLSSDGSSAFTNTSSLKNTSPLLGPLANNGGPTLTMALLPGSPAIDAGDDAAAPRTDQRGYPRPFSLAADIGAFEFGWTTLQASQPGSGGIDILASGISGQTCRLLVSSNYSTWMPIATNQMGSDGTCLFHDDCAPGAACRFYRLLMP